MNKIIFAISAIIFLAGCDSKNKTPPRYKEDAAVRFFNRSTSWCETTKIKYNGTECIVALKHEFALTSPNTYNVIVSSLQPCGYASADGLNQDFKKNGSYELALVGENDVYQGRPAKMKQLATGDVYDLNVSFGFDALAYLQDGKTKSILSSCEGKQKVDLTKLEGYPFWYISSEYHSAGKIFEVNWEVVVNQDLGMCETKAGSLAYYDWYKVYGVEAIQDKWGFSARIVGGVFADLNRQVTTCTKNVIEPIDQQDKNFVYRTYIASDKAFAFTIKTEN
jgi:hypothetical protein